jgi:hypothetical protein
MIKIQKNNTYALLFYFIVTYYWAFLNISYLLIHDSINAITAGSVMYWVLVLPSTLFAAYW